VEIISPEHSKDFLFDRFLLGVEVVYFFPTSKICSLSTNRTHRKYSLYSGFLDKQFSPLHAHLPTCVHLMEDFNGKLITTDFLSYWEEGMERDEIF